jgi:hypothetical protein
MTQADPDDPRLSALQLQFRERTSWHIRPVTVQRPPDCPLWAPPPDFHISFFTDPFQALARLQELYPEVADPVNLCLFLFHCSQVFPRSITRFIFDERQRIEQDSLLTFFFEAVDFDLTSVPECAARVFSRLALPYDMGKFALIVECFAQVYLDSNPYVIFTLTEIGRITVAAIVASIYKKKRSSMPYEAFAKWLSMCAINESYKQQLYKMVERSPIPTFFDTGVFEVEPEFDQIGCFSKSGGLSGSAKKRFFAFEDFMLCYFKDEKKKVRMGEIDLLGTYTTREKEKKKGGEVLRIRRFDGQLFGWKIVHGRRKAGHHREFVLAPHGKQSLAGWGEACNALSFIAVIANHYGVPCDKHP